MSKIEKVLPSALFKYVLVCFGIDLVYDILALPPISQLPLVIWEFAVNVNKTEIINSLIIFI